MDSNTIYLYDILRQFGADGLKQLLSYFIKNGSDDTLDDINNNTELLTYNEIKFLTEAGLMKNYKRVLLKNDIYMLMEK